jgi:HAMP domain-containing protein
MFKFKSITVKLFFLFLIVGIIPLFLIGFLSIRSTEGGIRKEVLNGLVRYTETKEGQIFAYIEFVKIKGSYFSKSDTIRRYVETFKKGQYINPSEVNDFLKKKAAMDEVLVGMSIVDLNGKVVFSSSKSEIGKDESNHKHFIEIAKEEKDSSIKSGLMIHEHFGLYNAFITSHPIKNEEGDILAVIDVVFSLNEIIDILNGDFQLEKGALTGKSGLEGMNSYVVNQEKIMFIHPIKGDLSMPHYERMKVDTLPVKECLENGKQIIDTYKTYTGKEVLGASMCIPDSRWVIISEISIDKAFLAVKEIYYQLVLMMIVSFLLVVGISLLLTDKVSKYLNKFTTASNQVARGNLDVKIDIDTDDEIGFLAKNLNKMIVSLKRSRVQIEKEISVRTKDLENINKYMVGREIKMIELKEKIKNIEKDGYDLKKKLSWDERLKNAEDMEENIILKLKNSYLRAINESDLDIVKKKKALGLIKELINGSVKHKKYLAKINKK